MSLHWTRSLLRHALQTQAFRGLTIFHKSLQRGIVSPKSLLSQMSQEQQEHRQISGPTRCCPGRIPVATATHLEGTATDMQATQSVNRARQLPLPAPKPPSGLGTTLSRTRLSLLVGESHHRLVVLRAPIGYGKSTLLNQWMGRRHQRGSARHQGELQEHRGDVGPFLDRLWPAVEAALEQGEYDLAPKVPPPCRRHH